jgi:NarL family two-component system response regulator YdfI
LCVELHPDVVLMDLRMPGMDGLSAIERLRTEQPGIAVVILTTFNEDDLMMRGLRLGAKGYLLKDTDRETLFNTIRAASRGETLLRPEILARVLAQGMATGAPASTQTDLTERELEVLRGVAQGERSKEIGLRLGITERTVKAHLASIYSRLGVDSRAAAIAVAAHRGIL